MGWLELLPLLRRLLPLLDRLPPLLEGVLAGRAGAKAGEQTAAHIAELTQSHTNLQATLADHSAALQLLAHEIATLNTSVPVLQAQVTTLAAQTSAVRAIALTTLIGVVLCLILLMVLLLRHV